MNKITTSTLPSFIAGRGIGFDRMFDLFDEAVSHHGTYPPYNIVKLSDDDFVVEVALAGYDMADLTITQDGNKLKIEGSKPELKDEEPVYLHRGISSRSFTREFVLAEHVSVEDAKFENGILSVVLHRELPEALKPRTIDIKRIGK